MTPADGKRRSGRRQLLLVASLFVVPLAAALWLYFSSGWRPTAGSHGELIESATADRARRIHAAGWPPCSGGRIPAALVADPSRPRRLRRTNRRNPRRARARKTRTRQGCIARAPRAAARGTMRALASACSRCRPPGAPASRRYLSRGDSTGRRQRRWHLYSGPAWQPDDELPCVRLGARPAQGPGATSPSLEYRLGDANARNPRPDLVSPRGAGRGPALRNRGRRRRMGAAHQCRPRLP